VLQWDLANDFIFQHIHLSNRTTLLAVQIVHNPRLPPFFTNLNLTLPLSLSTVSLPLHNNLILRRKVQTDAIHTMPLVRRRGEPLTLEYMTQVATAVGAHNLGPRHAERAVLVPGDRTGDAVKIGRPAAP